MLREAFAGVTRFAAFRDVLHIATDVLSHRLADLVAAGVLERPEYRDDGRRTRAEYVLTPAGSELKVVLGALQQWGDDHLPVTFGPTVVRRRATTGERVEVSFVGRSGRRITDDQVVFERTAAYPEA